MASLIWSDTSKNDLKEIYSFIAQDSRYYANSLINKINQSAKKLKYYPEIGRVVPEYQNVEIREIIFQNYRIIYQLTEKKIIILTVFHTSRDLEKFELEDWEIV
ncbi:MAG: type II toxin-antitoxin system RelE/ParE family toxin [Spirochaetales bacterium]|nr:type II toxin-antitoxin system RelE/ParE family toxin [Spirochaetales bacterium]